MVLKLTFQNGDTAEFPFHTGSQLSVTTPDGANGDKYGSWGEVTGIELTDQPTDVTVVELPPVEAPPAEPVAEPSANPTPIEQAQLADTPTGDGAAPSTDVTLATPADAITHATGLPLDDAHAHIVTALEKFPDDSDLLTAKADIEAAQAQAAGQ